MKSVKRSINGILLLDKPIGFSSNKVLQIVKRLYQAKKAGHTGSLDPLATGLLPICFGEATKFSQYWLDSDKTYRVRAKLGVRTTTSDAEGDIVFQSEVPHFTLADIEKQMAIFRGDIQQVPSMYSALKHEGQPLYKLARRGIEIERPARPITIYRFDLLRYANEALEMEVHCSKGTYIRTLIDDLGQALGVGAHVIALHRIQVGLFTASRMVALSKIENASQAELDAMLLPLGAGLEAFPNKILTPTEALALQQGCTVHCDSLPEGLVVLRTQQENSFLGLGEIKKEKTLVAKRLMRIA